MYAIIRRLSQALKKEMAEHDKLKDYVLKAWDLISRLEVKGVGLKSANHVDEEELLQLFEDDLVHVLRQYQGEDDIVDNAVRALKARKIIAHNPAKKGEYRLPTKSFAVWIKVQQAVGPDPRAKHGATSGHDEPETLGEG